MAETNNYWTGLSSEGEGEGGGTAEKNNSEKGGNNNSRTKNNKCQKCGQSLTLLGACSVVCKTNFIWEIVGGTFHDFDVSPCSYGKNCHKKHSTKILGQYISFIHKISNLNPWVSNEEEEEELDLDLFSYSRYNDHGLRNKKGHFYVTGIIRKVFWFSYDGIICSSADDGDGDGDGESPFEVIVTPIQLIPFSNCTVEGWSNRSQEELSKKFPSGILVSVDINPNKDPHRQCSINFIAQGEAQNYFDKKINSNSNSNSNSNKRERYPRKKMHENDNK